MVLATVSSGCGDPEPQPWYILDETVGWKPRPGFQGEIAGAARAFDKRGFLVEDSPQVLPSDRPKAVFLGDDVVFGSGVATAETFVEAADRQNPGADLINLAVPGYSTYQARHSLARALSVEPDLVVISFQFSDRRAGLPADVDAETRFAKLAEAERQGTGTARPAAADSLYIPDLRCRVKPDRYRRYLREMVQAVETAGAEVVFLALGDNPAAVEDLRAGMAARQAEELETAAEHLEAAVQRDNFFSDIARLQLAHVYESQERPEDQEAVLHTRDHRTKHGGRPIYDDRKYLEILRDVAAGEKIRVIDATGMAGEDYRDDVRLGAQGHSRLAEVLMWKLDPPFGHTEKTREKLRALSIPK